MKNRDWFSAMLRMVVLVEGVGASRRVRSLVLFRAADWAEARERALQLGLGAERSYPGGTGEQVRWRLEAVETIDLLGAEIVDGREVYAEPVDLDFGEAVAFDAEFRPEESEPGQSGV
ncbi:DUF4288 domain-containing protein [Cellulomonas composti]|uniref:DUF4288 domain-containing protein n=1 Tax=Cellulomonas composti TaxID=266130 RepID=A0A511JBS3_9CELL|nr:DUF4288 domain-containing protein [Cellulomonas composti]GEL95435.1 hypothetical protein CCO02nite_20930 [Cellulomonas composti]